MKLTAKEKKESIPVVMRRMREASGLTMRQTAAMVGISHVAISQFENQKLALPEYRIEQLLKAYGLTFDDLYRIVGRPPVGNLKDDCHAMIDRMDDEGLVAIRAVMTQMLRVSAEQKRTFATQKIQAVSGI